MKKFQGISNLAISDDLQGLLATEESPNRKNHFACSQKLFLWTVKDLRTYFYRKFEILFVKGQGNLQTQQLILIYTKVNNYLNFWTKFPLNNREPSKSLKFNLELSKATTQPRPSTKVTRCTKKKMHFIRVSMY